MRVRPVPLTVKVLPPIRTDMGFDSNLLHRRSTTLFAKNCTTVDALYNRKENSSECQTKIVLVSNMVAFGSPVKLCARSST